MFCGPGHKLWGGWPGHPRIQSLTHRTLQGVGVTRVYPDQDTANSWWHQTLSCWAPGVAV